MNTCKAPQSKEEFQAYYHFRWKLLRQPWGQELGSEQDELEEQSIHRMIVDENEQVIAIGRLHKTTQHEAQIRYMAVAEHSQGQGLGLSILNELELAARKIGVEKISLNARESAVKFYQKLGYKDQGFSHKLFDEIAHFTMSKHIDHLDEHQAELTEPLQSTWHQTIPLSKAMNIEVCFYNKHKLITHCDPIFNQNLHHTMFAGSIYTLATLTGWGWVYLQLAGEQLSGDIVLADANIRYHSPIKGPAHAIVSVEHVNGSLAMLKKSKKARFKITAMVYCGEQVAVTFNGVYVVIPKDS